MNDPSSPSPQTVPGPSTSTSSTVTVVLTPEVDEQLKMLNATKTFLSQTRLKIVNNITVKSIHHTQPPPLEGVRVLDLTRIVAGPYCTMILGDLGAEVIKIERPGEGDEARKWGPPFANNSKESSYFIALNRNKKSMCLDLKAKKGRQILYELAKKSDVLVENYVPGKLDELELGYQHLRNVAPHIIYCSITGYGPEGPYKSKPGYDVIAASIGGFLHITGPRDGEPCKAGVAMTDLSTGLYAHGAIMAALLQKYRTGKGQKIDCDLLSTQFSTLINIGSNYLNAGEEAQRWGTSHPSIVPYQAFRTKDGYFTIGVGSDAQFIQFCEMLNQPDLANEKKFKTNRLRVQHRIELIEILQSIITKKTNKELWDIFDGSSFPCGPINSLKEAFNDPHINAIGLIKELQHPVAGSIKVVGPPVKYSGGDNSVRIPPPLLGQHTEEILRDLLEYDDLTIRGLKTKNVI